jgi:hypothetical protein
MIPDELYLYDLPMTKAVVETILAEAKSLQDRLPPNTQCLSPSLAQEYYLNNHLILLSSIVAGRPPRTSLKTQQKRVHETR